MKFTPKELFEIVLPEFKKADYVPADADERAEWEDALMSWCNRNQHEEYADADAVRAEIRESIEADKELAE